MSKPIPITGSPRRIGGARKVDEAWPPVPPRADGTRRPLIDTGPAFRSRVTRPDTFEDRLTKAVAEAFDPANIVRDPGDGRRDKIRVRDPRQTIGTEFLMLDRKTVQAGWSPATVRATIQRAIARTEAAEKPTVADLDPFKNLRPSDPRDSCGQCRAISKYGGFCSAHSYR